MTTSTSGRFGVAGRALALAALLAGAAAAVRAEGDAPKDKAAPPADRMQWFREARFGMFIHWGLYAVPAGEWDGKTNYGEWIQLQAGIPGAEYEKLAARFNPVKFDAREWVRTAKAAGMRYMVITSKHHDGFCMYDTKLSDYSIVRATPYKRDPMKDLAAACREAGLKFCFYYSDPDWHHPDFPAKHSQRGFHGSPNPGADLEKYVTYMKGQVRELLTNYGPIGIMWFDGGGSFRGEPTAQLLHSQEIIDMIHELQPACLVNNRLGLPADYGTPEQKIPDSKSATPFEVCMTLNRHWGYNKADDNWKEAPEVIRNLCDIASKGGNYLLNVGPTAEGVFPPDCIRILADVGKWMAANGEAVYGTSASPWKKHAFDGRCTVKGNTLYVHVFKWPDSGPLTIPGLRGEIVGAEAVDKAVGAMKFEVKPEGDARTLLLSRPERPDPIATVVAVRFKEPPAVTEAAVEAAVIAATVAARQAADGSIKLKAADAIVHGAKARYETGGGKDNIGSWLDEKDWVSWEVQVDKPADFAVEVTFACAKGTGGSEYAVSAGGRETTGKVRETGSWTEFVTEKIGDLKIEKAGRFTVAVKVKLKPKFAVMNLKAIDLKPAKQ